MDPVSAQTPEKPAVSSPAATLLEAVGKARALEGVDPHERVVPIVGLGPTFAPLILEALSTGVLQGGNREEVLTEADADMLLEASARLGREASIPTLTAWAVPEQDRGRRLTALRLLERVGLGPDLDLVVGAGHPNGAEAPTDSEVLDQVYRSTRGIVLRNGNALRQLARILERARPEFATALIRAVGDVDTARALEWLCGQLKHDSRLDLCLLSNATRVALRLPPTTEETLFQDARAFLWSQDRQQVRACVQLVAALQDFGALERLVELLEDTDPVLRDTAHEALRQMTTLNLPPVGARWSSWWEEEKRWYRDEAPRLLHHLAANRSASVQKALMELASHRIERHRIALSVVQTLHSEDSLTVRRACTTLRNLRSPVAVEELIELLEEENDEVASEALRALEAITGHRLPPDPQAWASLVRG